MDVLLTEAVPHAADDTAFRLFRRGHRVVRCRASEAAETKCLATPGGEGCPLDRRHVDVVLDIRGDAPPTMTSREYGVMCAARAHVPVVVAGQFAEFPDWVTATTTDEDAVATVETVGALPDRIAARELARAVRLEILRVTGFEDTVVRIVDHGYFPEVLVLTSAPAHPSLIASVERVARASLRGHRRDFVHARVRFVRWPDAEHRAKPGA